MMMKVFPHGTGSGDKPSRYLVRTDYPGRDTRPPQVLRGDPAMTRALIDSIERRWKFTSGVLAWHPDDCVSEQQENAVMDAFEHVAFAGLEEDQRNILWVRHTHAGHHELHFLIPRLELSSGQDFNACPPGWQKDFDVFRDLFNWREGWARPDDPARRREVLPKKADLFRARLARWGKELRAGERDKVRDAILAHLGERRAAGEIRERTDILKALKELGLTINRQGKDYVSVIEPETGMKLRLKGGMFSQDWKAADREGRAHVPEQAAHTIARLEAELGRVLAKRTRQNRKRYPLKWKEARPAVSLHLPEKQKEVCHERNRADAASDAETYGGKLRDAAEGVRHTSGRAGGAPDASCGGSAQFEKIVQRCRSGVQQLADLVAEIEKRRIAQERERSSPRIRMR